MRILLLSFCLFLGAGQLTAQSVTIGVTEIDHFDPYFEEVATQIYDFLLQEVAKQPGLTLVETSSFAQVTAEQERQKNEGFIDGVTADQGKYLGAQLLLVPEYDQDGGTLRFSLRNLETGEISCVNLYPVAEYLPEYQVEDRLFEELSKVLATCLAGNVEIVWAQVAEVLEEKSGKARRLLIYTEENQGLKKGDDITIFQVLKKQVGGKAVDFEDVIGTARISEVENDNFFNVTVKSGGKEIAALLAQKVILYAKP